MGTEWGVRPLKKVAWACVVLTLLTSALRAEPIDDYNTALKLYEQKRWDAAAKGFAAFVKSAPEHAKSALAQLYQGQALTHAQKYNEARAVFREFLKSHSDHPDAPLAAYRVGESSYFLNEYPEAAAELGEFVTKYPNHDLTGWGWQYLGEAQLQLAIAAQFRYSKAVKEGKATEATADAKFLMEKAGESIKALNVVLGRKTSDAEKLEAKYALAQAEELLAEAYRIDAKDAESIQAMSQALELFREVSKSNSPRAAESLFTLAKLDYQSGKYAEAAAGFERIIAIAPRGSLIPTAELNAGYSLYQISEFAKAEQHFAVAAKSASMANSASFWVGMCRKGQENWVGAIEVFTDLAAQASTGEFAEKATYHWADCEAKRKRYPEARQLYESVVNKWPTSPLSDDSYYSAADCALKAGDVAGAVALAESFSSKYPSSSLKQLCDLVLGKATLARGDQSAKTDLTKATADYQSAATLFRGIAGTSQVPRTAMQARVHLSFAEKRLKNYPAVVEALNPIAQSIRQGDAAAAEFSAVLPMLGEAYLLAGQPAEAEAVLQDALKGLPADADRRQCLAKLAESRATLGKWNDAQSTLEQLQQADAEGAVTAEASSRIADQAIAAKNWEMADRLLTSVIQVGESSPYYSNALIQLGEIQFTQNQFSAAAQTYQKLLDSKDVETSVRAAASLNYGVCLEKDAGNDPEKLLAASKVLEDGVLRFAIPNDKAQPTDSDRQIARHVVDAARTAAAIRVKLVTPIQADPQKPLTADDLKAWIAQPDVKVHLLAADQLNQTAFEQNEKLAADQAVKPDDLLNDWALQLFNAGDQSRGDAIFTRLYKEFPASPHAGNAKLTVARGHAEEGRQKEARALFQSLQDDVGLDPVLKQEALDYWMKYEARLENWAESGRLAQLILGSGPTGPAALDAKFRLGEAQLQRREFDAAVKSLTELRADPAVQTTAWKSDLDLLWAEAKLQESVAEKDYEGIRTVLNALLTAPSTGITSDQAHELLGRIDFKESRFPEARDHFEKVTNSPTSAKSPLAAKAQLEIGDTYYLEKKFDDATIAYTAVHANYRFPEYQSPALLKVASIDIEQKHWTQAQGSLTTLLTEFPNSPEAEQAKKLLVEVEKKLPAKQ